MAFNAHDKLNKMNSILIAISDKKVESFKRITIV